MLISSEKRLEKAYKNAKRIPFSTHDKFILFSDCHRGDNSFADDFANNKHVYQHALNYYLKENYTYIELGDGDELWENKKFATLFNAHKNIYLTLKQFYLKNQLHLIFGNHDMVYKNQKYTDKHLSHYTDTKSAKPITLFKNIRYQEAIVLVEKSTNQELFLTHGHQADLWNYVFWKWSRLLVRILWKPLQIIGIADPTSPAKNHKELIKVERNIKGWMDKKKPLITITGHTHRPRFPKPGEIPFFNDGSCVHPRSITGIEIVNNTISLIKWHMDITENGFLKIKKTVLEEAIALKEYTIKT